MSVDETLKSKGRFSQKDRMGFIYNILRLKKLYMYVAKL